RRFPLLGPPQNDSREPERHRAGEQQSERGSGNGAPTKALLSESFLTFSLAEKPGQEPDKQTHDGAAQESRRGRRGEATEGGGPQRGSAGCCQDGDDRGGVVLLFRGRSRAFRGGQRRCRHAQVLVRGSRTAVGVSSLQQGASCVRAVRAPCT